jgi:FtsH-binding integral membrane protein
MALGTYLVTVEVPVRITYDPAAAEQYNLMRAYLPFGFALWILSLVFLVLGIVSGTRKPLAIFQLKKPFLMVNLIVGVAIGVLALASTFLPWVIAERAEPFIETRGGSFNVGQYHALTGVNLMSGTNNMVGDIILLVFVGAIIGVLHIPLLTLLEKERGDAKRAFLYFLGAICIIGPIASIYIHRIWWISLRLNGTLGFSATSISPGIGSLTATACAVGLLAFGLINTIKKMKIIGTYEHKNYPISKQKK